jgi:hypothetical protein
VFLECDVSSSPREVDLEEIQTYVPLMTHVDFILTTADALHVENASLAKNHNSPTENLGVGHVINENEGARLVNEEEGLEKNERHSLMITRRNLNKKMMILSPREDNSVKEEVLFQMTMSST